MTSTGTTWRIYKGTGVPHSGNRPLPEAPPWRRFAGKVPEGFDPASFPLDVREARRAAVYQADTAEGSEIDAVNAALYLRRPLLITGRPGTGKSSLAYSVAGELQLGPVLYWPITTRSTLKEGLYDYDAIGRLQAAKTEDQSLGIEDFIELGPLGTALLPSSTPRVLIIDEIDKSDIDLPNDLLNIFEEGRFEIPELSRLREGEHAKPVRMWKRLERAAIEGGEVVCREFPLIFMTSNGERDFPAPFLRRCLRLDIQEPSREKLARIVNAQFMGLNGEEQVRLAAIRDELIESFLARRSRELLATDQLLNAVHVVLRADLSAEEKQRMEETVLRHLTPDS